MGAPPPPPPLQGLAAFCALASPDSTSQLLMQGLERSGKGDNLQRMKHERHRDVEGSFGTNTVERELLHTASIAAGACGSWLTISVGSVVQTTFPRLAWWLCTRSLEFTTPDTDSLVERNSSGLEQLADVERHGCRSG